MMEDSVGFVKKYLEDLLSFFALNVDVDVFFDEDNQLIEANIPSTTINAVLIGQRSNTLKALQVIVSQALAYQTDQYQRLNVDVAGYKKKRQEQLTQQAQEWFQEVKTKQKNKTLKPMNPSERRLIHQMVNSEEGIESESVGEGSQRHIILKLK